MDPPRNTQFVVTPWRDSKDLLRLRHDLYGSDTVGKERAVNKVFAWRLRKPDGLPLLLESTADIVDVVLQDEKDVLKHNALRLLYATALSRFITGLADTQVDLTRDKPSWFSPGKSLQLPLPLLEIRHRIVHRHLPSLAELKRAAQDSLAWLWEWYWSQLDYAFGIAKDADVEVEGVEVIREKLQSVLRTYVKERKSEVKAKRKDDRAAETAVSTYTMRYGARYTSTPTLRTQNVLLRLLVDEKMILPTDKKVGSSMSGAFLIWDPLLTRLCDGIVPVSTILASLTSAMNASRNSMVSADMDPVKEGLYDWALHVLRSKDWSSTQRPKIIENMLIQCFSAPTYWNIKLAEALLRDGDVPNREQWRAVLGAAKGDAMDVDVDVEMIEKAQPVSTELRVKKEKVRGPQKVVGLWKARPIGWVPEGWEDDE